MGDAEEEEGGAPPVWMREYGEEDETAVGVLQCAGRCRLARKLLRELRAEEAKRPQNTGWGFDTLTSVYMCNAKTVPSTRMIGEKMIFPCEKAVAHTVVQTYEGKLDLEGRYSGQGKATLVNGATYDGEWENGLMHGKGLYKWPSGVSYKGPFVMGKMLGKGSMRWPGGNVYDGEVCDGRRHGRGRFQMVMESDEVEDESAVVTYEGMWANGRRNGQGTLLYDSDGKQKYDGFWRDDERHGQGVMYYRTGNVYSGTWRAGKHHGQGQMLWYTQNEVYVGGWQNGLQHGKGEHVWFMEVQSGSPFQTQNRYKGDWRNGLRHGHGIFEYADGSRYSGEWVGGKKHGQGSFIYPDGKSHEGMFDNDKITNNAPPKKWAASGEIVLKIEDVLAEAESPAAELTAIRNALLQYMSELKQIFRYYSQPVSQEPVNKMTALLQSPSSAPLGAGGGGGGWGTTPGGGASLIRLTGTQQNASIDNAFAISMVDFWKFAKDCRIPDSRLTLAQIDRIFLLCDKSVGGGLDGSDVHNPSQKLIFRQFLEAVVRLADFKYQDLLPVSQRLCHALYHNVLPYACQEGGGALKRALEAPEMKAALQPIDPGVRLHFREMAQPNDTMSLRKVLDTCARRGYLDDKCTHGQVVDMYYQSVNDDVVYVRANNTNIDVELIYEEFLEVLLRIVDKKTPAQAATSEKAFIDTSVGFLQKFLDVGVETEQLPTPPPPPVPVQLPSRNLGKNKNNPPPAVPVMAPSQAYCSTN